MHETNLHAKEISKLSVLQLVTNFFNAFFSHEEKYLEIAINLFKECANELSYLSGAELKTMSQHCGLKTIS